MLRGLWLSYSLYNAIFCRIVDQWVDTAASAPCMAELMRAGREGVRVWLLLQPYFDSSKRRVGVCVAPRLVDAKRHHFRLGELFWSPTSMT